MLKYLKTIKGSGCICLGINHCKKYAGLFDINIFSRDWTEVYDLLLKNGWMCPSGEKPQKIVNQYVKKL